MLQAHVSCCKGNFENPDCVDRSRHILKGQLLDTPSQVLTWCFNSLPLYSFIVKELYGLSVRRKRTERSNYRQVFSILYDLLQSILALTHSNHTTILVS